MTLSFENLAEHFDTHRGLPADAMHAWMQLVDELAEGRSLDVIEPGIGTGRVSLPLATMGHTVWGGDIAAPMLERCRASAEALGVRHQVQLHLADATELPVGDGAFGVGVVAQLLYLVPDWPTVLDELVRVVRPGGHVIHLTEPTTESPSMQLWSRTWREMIERTGYRHTALSPTDEDVLAEFQRRWPDVETRRLASWSFGQSVAYARATLGESLRPLYSSVSDADWRATVDEFTGWSHSAFPDGTTDLGGEITLTALIASV